MKPKKSKAHNFNKLDKIIEKPISERYREAFLREEAKPYYAESSDFDSPTIPGEVKNEKSFFEHKLWFVAFVIISILALILGFTVDERDKELDHFKLMNGIYINGEDAYIRFNMSDQNQLAMLNQIQAYCQFKGIDRCGRFANEQEKNRRN